MPLRVARYSDLPLISAIFAESFHDEELHAYFFPYRGEYPEDYKRAWHQKILKRWWDYSRIFVVFYDMVEIGAGSAKRQERITGVAEWQRSGDGWEKLWGNGKWDPRACISHAVSIRNLISDSIFPNRASIHATPQDPDPLTQQNFEARMGPFVEQFYDPKILLQHRHQHWELHTLAVRPGHQRRGIGRELVGWGLERARQEGVPTVVCAAKDLEGYYQSCGFEDLVGWASTAIVNGLRNPLEERGIGGGAILWSRLNES